MDLKGSERKRAPRFLIGFTSQNLPGVTEGKTDKMRIVGLRSRNRTPHLPGTKQERGKRKRGMSVDD